LRKRKKAARADSMKGRGRNNNSRSKLNGKANTTSEGTLCLLRDDPGIGPLDRNRLVLTCGRCGEKTLCKGLRREIRVEEKPLKPRRKPVAASRTTNGSLTGEFERLPSLSKKPPPPQPSYGKSVTQKPSFKTTATPLEQKLGKKKNKPKKISNSKKGGNLMNFLSSLNDH